MEAIKIEGFSKSYGSFRAVKNLNLTVRKGEVMGFVGKNGAGKSTTIRSMMNLIHPSEGKITILGMDSLKEAKAIREKISYVPSETIFYERLSCEDLLRFCCSVSGASSKRIKELADYFELDLKKNIMDLSLGNRKKVSLIQAFLKDPEIIILDEPTSGLDPLMQERFFQLVIKEKEKGATIFLSSHNLSEVEKYCDRVSVIKDGELVDLLDMNEVKIHHRQTVTYTLKDGKTITHDVDEDINNLIKHLATLDLAELEIKTKSVEDEFIEYYKEAKNHE